MPVGGLAAIAAVFAVLTGIAGAVPARPRVSGWMSLLAGWLGAGA